VLKNLHIFASHNWAFVSPNRILDLSVVCTLCRSASLSYWIFFLGVSFTKYSVITCFAFIHFSSLNCFVLCLFAVIPWFHCDISVGSATGGAFLLLNTCSNDGYVVTCLAWTELVKHTTGEYLGIMGVGCKTNLWPLHNNMIFTGLKTLLSVYIFDDFLQNHWNTCITCHQLLTTQWWRLTVVVICPDVCVDCMVIVFTKSPHVMYFASTPLPSSPYLLLSEKDVVEWC